MKFQRGSAALSCKRDEDIVRETAKCEWKHSRLLHPCAHLLLDKDIRREIGIIRIKGDKIVTYIDGTTADGYGYLKLDLLRVIVVEIIAKTFQRINLPVMDVDELLDKVKNDNSVWNLYAKGYTQGLNK